MAKSTMKQVVAFTCALCLTLGVGLCGAAAAAETPMDAEQVELMQTKSVPVTAYWFHDVDTYEKIEFEIEVPVTATDETIQGTSTALAAQRLGLVSESETRANPIKWMVPKQTMSITEGSSDDVRASGTKIMSRCTVSEGHDVINFSFSNIRPVGVSAINRITAGLYAYDVRKTYVYKNISVSASGVLLIFCSGSAYTGSTSEGRPNISSNTSYDGYVCSPDGNFTATVGVFSFEGNY